MAPDSFNLCRTTLGFNRKSIENTKACCRHRSPSETIGLPYCKVPEFQSPTSIYRPACYNLRGTYPLKRGSRPFENPCAGRAIPACGVETADEFLVIAGDNAERMGSEASFAMLGGACPIDGVIERRTVASLTRGQRSGRFHAACGGRLAHPYRRAHPGILRSVGSPKECPSARA